MNDQANKVLAELLQKASNGIDAAVSFSQAQMPDVIEQLMHWMLASYSLRIVTCLLIIPAMCLAFRKAYQWHESYDKETAGFFGLLFSAAIGLSCLVILFATVGDLIQLWLAPKIWLIEYSAQLMNQN